VAAIPAVRKADTSVPLASEGCWLSGFESPSQRAICNPSEDLSGSCCTLILIIKLWEATSHSTSKALSTLQDGSFSNGAKVVSTEAKTQLEEVVAAPLIVYTIINRKSE
jgi:hypothetical protein